MTIFHAHLDTQHFRFDAFGETKAGAMKALRLGFRLHAKQYQLSSTWYYVFKDSIVVTEVALGACLRDNQPLTVKGDSSWLT